LLDGILERFAEDAFAVVNARGIEMSITHLEKNNITAVSALP
jgi:hypothetical protein